MGTRYLRPLKLKGFNFPAEGMYIKLDTNSDGNISAPVVWVRFGLRLFISMVDYKPLIACLSRAIGNDLINYEVVEGDCTLHLWPPISSQRREALKGIIEYFHPKVSVRISPKRGTIRLQTSHKQSHL